MTEKHLIAMFDRHARAAGFESNQGFWLLTSDECLVTLDLQKSRFGPSFEMNLKVFVQGLFGQMHLNSSKLAKGTGDIFRRHPPEFADVFNLGNKLSEDSRDGRMRELFEGMIGPMSRQLLSRSSIKQLAREKPDEIFLLPAVKKELGV